MTNGLMIILPDRAGPLFGKYDGNGLLDRVSACAFATKLGYDSKVIEYPYIHYASNPQFLNALHVINTQPVTGIYAFGSSGYNAARLYAEMHFEKRFLITKVIIANCPAITAESFQGLDPAKLSIYPLPENVDYLNLPAWILNNG